MKNLFDYATKELSQDAFLRWLFENYNCEHEDVCAQCKVLLSAFTKISNLETDKISELETFSQWKKIDILVKFNYEDNIYCIAIEDKVFSEEHSSQLENYNKQLNEYANWLKGQYTSSEVIIKKIFFKPTKLSEEEKARVENSGWIIFDIDKIFNLFDTNHGSSSDVLDDYRGHIHSIYLASETTQKPTSNEGNIDFIKWTSYFNNTVIPNLRKKDYTVGVWKAGQYPYICLNIIKKGYNKNIPYLEVRSRDCLNDQFIARFLCYGVEVSDLKEQQAQLINNISKLPFNTKGIVTKKSGKEIYPKQLGYTDKLTAKTDDEFIKLIEDWADKYLEAMKDWH